MDWYEAIAEAKKKVDIKEATLEEGERKKVSLNLSFGDILDILLFVLSVFRKKQ